MTNKSGQTQGWIDEFVIYAVEIPMREGEVDGKRQQDVLQKSEHMQVDHEGADLRVTISPSMTTFAFGLFLTTLQAAFVIFCIGHVATDSTRPTLGRIGMVILVGMIAPLIFVRYPT